MTQPNFRQLPRYQRKVQKRESMREAEGYAVPHLDDIVSEASSQQAAREEYGKSRGQQLDLREKKFDLSKRRFDISKDLTTKRETARKDIADRSFALDREMLDIRKEQDKWATGVGVANIGVETMGAISSIRAAEEEAMQMRQTTDMFVELMNLYKKRGLNVSL